MNFSNGTSILNLTVEAIKNGAKVILAGLKYCESNKSGLNTVSYVDKKVENVYIPCL